MSKSERIPDGLASLLEDLKYLAMIKPMFKLNVINKTFCDTQSWYDTIWRYSSKESRDTSVMFVREVVRRSDDAVRLYAGNAIFLNLLINHLQQAKTGLNILSQTYTDPQIISKIMTIIDDIDIILVSHRQYICTPEVPKL